MSVKVNANYGGSGGGLGNLMSLYGAANQFSGGFGDGSIPGWEQSDQSAKEGYGYADSMLGNGPQVRLEATGADDPFMTNLNAMKRRQSTMVNPKGGSLGDQKAGGIAGLIGSVASLV